MGTLMRAAMQFGLLLVVLSAVARRTEAESTNDQWEAKLAYVQSLIQARTNEVRELRKNADALVESLNKLAQTNVVKLTPEYKNAVAQKRLEYYTRLGALNAAAIEMEHTLPQKVAPIARQKVLEMLVRLRDELRFTVVSLNHVARALKEL
jgi:urease accessory protein UreF